MSLPQLNTRPIWEDPSVELHWELSGPIERSPTKPLSCLRACLPWILWLRKGGGSKVVCLRTPYLALLPFSRPKSRRLRGKPSYPTGKKSAAPLTRPSGPAVWYQSYSDGTTSIASSVQTPLNTQYSTAPTGMGLALNFGNGWDATRRLWKFRAYCADQCPGTFWSISRGRQ